MWRAALFDQSKSFIQVPLFGEAPPTTREDLIWPGADGVVRTEFDRLMRQAGQLMSRHLPVAMAAVLGQVDGALCRELSEQVRRSAECICWAGEGPLLTVIMRRGLVGELRPMMNDMFVRYPDLFVGVAISDLLADEHDLWLAARLALQAAMAKRDNLVVLNGEEACRSVEEYLMANAMRRDLHDGGRGFAAYYQPQMDLAANSPAGVEALARWSWNQDRVPPATFVPVAEKYGLVGRLGEIMLGHAARTLTTLRREGIGLPKIAVNVSPDQMKRGDFLRMALDLTRDEGLDPADIELEITESLAGSGGEEFHRWLGDMVAAGFSVAIDDFGTGTSTLARIREIPATKLKLDRALVAPLPDDASGRRVCGMAVGLAKSLGMVSLAEGVETKEQADWLRNAGCQLGQGYYWARPLPEAELGKWWQRQLASAQ
jgi:EAL domain-containing protein (putative c-di-GMP-specific phosphodiesterase class I)